MGKTTQPAQPYIPTQAGITAAGNSSPGGAPATQQGTRPVPASAAPKAQTVVKGSGGGAASPPSVQVMPLAQVLVTPAQSPYVTVGMEDLAPIYTADGAMVPATSRGRWGQLRAAGRP